MDELPRHDTSGYPKTRPGSAGDLDNVRAGMACSLRDLFASMPEIDDLFAEVFGGPPPGPPAPSIAHVANADRQQQAAVDNKLS